MPEMPEQRASVHRIASIAAACAAAINQDLTIVLSALSAARRERRDLSALEALEAAQRIAWHSAMLLSVSGRHGARPCTLPVEKLIERWRAYGDAA